jgi:exodeoxyribonuclease-3
VRVVSFNANGLRSAAEKGFMRWFRRESPDIVCLQETRASKSDLRPGLLRPKGYFAYFHEAEKKGYSGVAIYTKKEPDRVVEGLGIDDIDREGRYLRADFGSLSVISLYLPSGSSSEERQAYKYSFMRRFREHLARRRDESREFLIAGDWNIAHRNIDLENWRSNQKTSGFLPDERAWLDQIYDELGWVDAHRAVSQAPREYTWWSNRGQAWAKNVGWRIDLQVVSPRLGGRARAVSVYRRRKFSDHAPLTIEYDWEL